MSKTLREVTDIYFLRFHIWLLEAANALTTNSIHWEIRTERRWKGKEQHQKCQHQEEIKPNQYSNCMHVSILLCYCVTILKSPNYAHKNLSYAYICMKVFSFSRADTDKSGSRFLFRL